MELRDHLSHLGVPALALSCFNHLSCPVFEVLRELEDEVVELRDTLSVGLVSIFFIRGRILQLSLELMRFDKTFLHLLLEVLKSGTLPHIDLLVSGLHLAWTKLFD